MKDSSKLTLAICSLSHSLCLQTPSRVKFNDIVFKNIRGTSSSQVAVNLLCSKGVPCQNVKLIDINLAYNGQGATATASCANVKGTSSDLEIPPSCLLSSHPFIHIVDVTS